MTAFIMAVFVSFIGVLPLVVRRHMLAVPIVGILSILILWPSFYAGMPSLVWPLYGVAGAIVIALWAVTAVGSMIYVSCNEEDGGRRVKRPGIMYALVFPIVGVLTLVGVAFNGCSCVRADDYSKLIGKFDERAWTQDVQPADPKHIRLVPRELAMFLADKQLAQAPGSIGSQFEITGEGVALQRVDEQLWWVIPLDFKGFSVWQSTDYAPGYIMVHGDDPNYPPILKYKEKFVYTPGAYFSKNLERHLQQNGYLFKGLTDYTLEVDEQNKAWWVVTVFEPSISFWGEKMTGVAMVDPQNGDIKFFPTKDIPTWVDRAMPEVFISDYITQWGELNGGWWNLFWAHSNIVEPEEPAIVYGADGEPYWVTGITSTNANDEALVGLFYTNSRTGKTVKYHAIGGTDAAMLTVVNNKVSYKKWHGCSPTLYNIYGVMTSVVPLLGESHTFQGVALVRVDNQQAVEAANLTDALREYQKLLGGSGNQMSPEAAHKLNSVEGTVDRFASEVRGGTTLYYVHLAGVPHLFTGGSDELASPKLPLTMVGDSVAISFFASGEDVVPMQKFDNKSMFLKAAANQTEVRQEAAARQEQVTVQRDVRDARDSLGRMNEADLLELMRLRDQQSKSKPAEEPAPASQTAP